MSSDLELEEKMKTWADNQPKWKKYRDNIPLLRHIYAKHNIAGTVKDCMVEGRAKFKVLILKNFNRKAITLCSKCFKKSCDTDSCGAEDYEDFQPHSYQAIDMKGDMIVVEITPFDTELKPLKDDTEYVLEGSINEYKDKKTLRIETIQECEEITSIKEQDDKAIELAGQIMQLGNGKIGRDKFYNMMSQFSDTQIQDAMAHLKLKEEGEEIVHA